MLCIEELKGLEPFWQLLLPGLWDGLLWETLRTKTGRDAYSQHLHSKISAAIIPKGSAEYLKITCHDIGRFVLFACFAHITWRFSIVFAFRSGYSEASAVWCALSSRGGENRSWLVPGLKLNQIWEHFERIVNFVDFLLMFAVQVFLAKKCATDSEDRSCLLAAFSLCGYFLVSFQFFSDFSVFSKKWCRYTAEKLWHFRTLRLYSPFYLFSSQNKLPRLVLNHFGRVTAWDTFMALHGTTTS